jgi:hypothetical protein
MLKVGDDFRVNAGRITKEQVEAILGPDTFFYSRHGANGNGHGRNANGNGK